MASRSRTPIFAFDNNADNATPSRGNHRSSSMPLPEILLIELQVPEASLKQIPELLLCLRSQMTLTSKKGAPTLEGICKRINFSRVYFVIKVCSVEMAVRLYLLQLRNCMKLWSE